MGAIIYHRSSKSSNKILLLHAQIRIQATIVTAWSAFLRDAFFHKKSRIRTRTKQRKNCKMVLTASWKITRNRASALLERKMLERKSSKQPCREHWKAHAATQWNYARDQWPRTCRKKHIDGMPSPNFECQNVFCVWPPAQFENKHSFICIFWYKSVWIIYSVLSTHKLVCVYVISKYVLFARATGSSLRQKTKRSWHVRGRNWKGSRNGLRFFEQLFSVLEELLPTLLAFSVSLSVIIFAVLR